MFRKDQVEVLVVGAGPVGLLTALCLAEGGIDVKIIDQECGVAAHSYACVLHPHTLEVLDRLGLATEVLKLGQRVDTVAFYEGESRRAEIRLSELPGPFPFVVVLPQSTLEALLERKLNQHGRIQVHWNHRLTDLQTERDTVTGTIEKLGQSAKGYGVPDMDWEVIRTLHTRATFVVGADGHNSHVRQCLGLDYQDAGDPEFFVVYEFESDGPPETEARMVLDDRSTSVLWPLPHKKYRWSFQLIQADELAEFPSKDRTDVMILQPAADVFTRQDVKKFAQVRAPWFKRTVDEFTWSIDVKFERRLAQRFGQGRCWLAGDAAHQTGPAAMQSMNVGMCEAENLAARLRKIVREKASIDQLEAYNRERRDEWERLLGMKGGLKPRDETNPWIKERCAKILPCIPASGQDLKCFLDQLRLDFQLNRLSENFRVQAGRFPHGVGNA